MKSKNSSTAERYMADVLAGRIVVGQLVRRAIERHVHDLARGRERGIDFDRAAAERVLKFFSFLRHSKGEWARKPFALSPWQQCLLWILFGWKRADGTRRFRLAHVEVARKNGKSTLLSGVLLYLLLGDGEQGAEVYAAATKRDQARIVFEEAKRMAAKSPGIRRRVVALKNNLHVPATESKLEPLCSKSETLDGLNVSAAAIDELHAHPDRTLFDVIETATGARRQPLIFNITTAGFNQQSIWWELRGDALRILDGFDKPGGITDDTFFCWICTLDPEDDWTDPRVWIKANPNLGVSVKLDDLERKAAKAQRIPSAQNNFRTKHLDEPRQQAVLWLPLDKWDACQPPAADAELLGKPCFAGLDLSTTRDVTAFVLAFPREKGFDLRCKFWIPLATAEARSRDDRVPYLDWARQGLVTICDGEVIDYAAIRAHIVAESRLYKIQELAFDPHNATEISQQLAEQDGLTLVEHRQGFISMNAPSKEFERLVVLGLVRHGAHPVLRWMAGNVSVKTDEAGNIKPIKPAHGDARKIDGIIAAVMPIGRAMLHPDTSGPSIFTL